MAKFKTSARTVEMLGRQQIAGIPTAISELFKNAHDAYATRVEADLYRPENLFVLRDDGLGMTLEDIAERWLVVGTDSKLSGSPAMANVAASLGMPARTPTGEKGIGRLAIAAIGPQVLVVTRAKRTDGLHSTIASFVNWSMFELPGIPLEDIEVPLRQFYDGSLPTRDDLLGMVNEVRENLGRLRHYDIEDIAERIDLELDAASFDVEALQQRFDAAALTGSAAGTHFYIQPVDPMLQISLDAAPERRRIGDLQRTLIGFTNTMMPDGRVPAIATAFRDHKSLDLFDSIIGPEAFFTPDEFGGADHHIRGDFDEYGQFSGTVSVYGGEPEEHRVAWNEARGRRTLCGPFSINFAYVQGVARESRIPREQWEKLTAKLDQMGGLYIYRNGIRILPYGGIDNDFLGIEERRNLGAAYYFFSARRMFGAIELPPDSAINLIEKAGREGFRDNRAYRQFREILVNLLTQLAADYFREESSLGQYHQLKTTLDTQARLLERQKSQSRTRRRVLAESIEELAAKLNSSEPQVEVENALEELQLAIGAANVQTDSEAKLDLILDAERVARSRITELGASLRLAQPRGFALSKSLHRDLTAHRAQYAKLESELLEPAFAAIHRRVSQATEGLDAGRRRRFDVATADVSQAAKRTVVAHERVSREQLQSTTDRVTGAVRQAMRDFEIELQRISQRVQRTELSSLSDSEVVQLRLALDSEINDIASLKGGQMEAIGEQLQAIVVEPDETGQIITHMDLVGATEEQLLALEERADADLELAQLGMAVEIIDHEFQSTIRTIRENLQRLRAWADVNSQLADVYQGIRVSFDHLDGYLTLFTPLHRRLYRSEIEIKGQDVHRFLLNLFGKRLNRHGIEASATRAFLRHRFKGYPSSFYPVFVNLLDNAIFWLRDQTPPRTIRLDVRDDVMIVADNGPGVAPEDREAIFELGFTRKPGGRGLGLHISRDVLAKVGYELTVTEPENGVGTEFRIKRKGISDDD